MGTHLLQPPQHPITVKVPGFAAEPGICRKNPYRLFF